MGITRQAPVDLQATHGPAHNDGEEYAPLPPLEHFQVTESGDAAQRDHNLICTACGDRVCTVEHGDTIAVLVSTARSHVCDAETDEMTTEQERFDQILEELLDEENGSTLLAIPGIYEVVSEHFNNEVLERMEEEGPAGECAECRGWDHFNIGTDREGIQRCDSCEQFEDDDAAARAHDLHCRCGMGVERPAQQCHGCGRAFDPTRSYWVDGDSVELDSRIYCKSCAADQEGVGNETT